MPVISVSTKEVDVEESREELKVILDCSEFKASLRCLEPCFCLF